MKNVIQVGLAAACLSIFTTPAGAQDLLAEAKGLYDSASYTEALSALNQVSSAADVVDLEKYRALCLLALDRPQDAERSLERLAMTRPLYTLNASDASPKLVALFQVVRKRTLPEASKQTYLRARASFEKGGMAEAAQQFSDVIAMADAAPPESAALMGDLKMLSTGFLKLAETALAPKPAAASPTAPPAPAPVQAPSPTISPLPATSTPAPSSPPPSGSNRTASTKPPRGDVRAAAAAQLSAPGVSHSLEQIYDLSDTTVKPAVALSRPIPKWERPAALKVWGYQGLLQIVVDENGSVVDATMVKPIHPAYDRSLVNAARDWRFVPATIGGRPVTYRMVYSIVVPAPAGAGTP